MPPFDISDLVRLDPEFESCGLHCDGVRLTQDKHSWDDDFSYEATCRITRLGRSWPDPQIHLMLYNSDGLAIEDVWLHEWRKTTEPKTRVTSGSASTGNITYAELVTEPNKAADVDQSWTDVPISRDLVAEEESGVAFEGLLCQRRPHFQTRNLVLIQASGVVRSHRALSDDLALHLVVFGNDGVLLQTAEATVEKFGKRTKRTFMAETTVYDHLEVADVCIEVDEPTPFGETNGEAISPAHAIAILTSLGELQRSVESLQETIEEWNAG